MAAFTVQHEESETKGRFFIANHAGFTVAESTYSKAGTDRIIIDHTEVNDSLRNQGAGLALIEQAVAYAHEHRLKILPLCPFANATFKKHPDWSDVL